MNVEPIYSNIGQVYNTENFFIIPKYQRPYSWEEEHIKDFLCDLSSCYYKQIDHFLGAIVTIETKITGTNKSTYEVIDGQQRLTTISLFAFALLNHYKDIQVKLKDNISNYSSQPLWETIELSIKELTEQYVILKFNDNGNVRQVYKLSPSNSDYDFYSSFLLNIPTTTVKNNSNEKIRHAYELLYKYIDELVKYDELINVQITIEMLNEKYCELDKIIHILNDKLFLLNVVTKNKSDAYKLFQTLNNRGLNLNVADLLKARTLEMLDSFPSYQEVAEKTWICLSDSPNIVDFLTSTYFYETGNNPNKNDLYDSLLNQFFPGQINSEEEAKKLCDKLNILYNLFKKYTCIIEGEWPYPDTDNSNITDWEKNRLYILIKKLKHTQCIPLLLHASNKDENTFFKFLHLTERFFFKAKIIYSLHAGKLTKLYSSACKCLFTNPNSTLLEYKNIIVDFNSKNTPDDKFEENIDINLHYKTSGGNSDLKYLFSLINDYYDFCIKSDANPSQFMNLSTDCFQITDFDQISIEHISAQNGSDNFNGKYIHKLGNLTLLSKKLNIKLANSNFTVKKPHIINTSLRINSYFKDIDAWTDEFYRERHNIIIKYTKMLFDLSK